MIGFTFSKLGLGVFEICYLRVKHPEVQCRITVFYGSIDYVSAQELCKKGVVLMLTASDTSCRWRADTKEEDEMDKCRGLPLYM